MKEQRSRALMLMLVEYHEGHGQITYCRKGPKVVWWKRRAKADPRLHQNIGWAPAKPNK